MKCVYEAANSVEAHMIANMLEQHDITTRIDGEFLTGGIGELPAAGLVRVMAEEKDFERARHIIGEWEKKSPPDKTTVPRKSIPGPAWFLFGVVVSLGAMSWVYRSRTLAEGIDFNGDGRLDERFIYEDQHLSKVEVDANLDGRVDTIYTCDPRGVPLSAILDTDFDGRFETKQKFDHGQLQTAEIDREMDGKIERREEYQNGVLATVSMYAADGYNVVKREHYEHGVLTSAEYDSDRDGVFDTTYKYDRFGEIVEIARN